MRVLKGNRLARGVVIGRRTHGHAELGGGPWWKAFLIPFRLAFCCGASFQRGYHVHVCSVPRHSDCVGYASGTCHDRIGREKCPSDVLGYEVTFFPMTPLATIVTTIVR